ncbi:MAG: RHS repeat-associated core domain-containing protein [Candidatus Electrothrix sp. AUS4]|nr:RHS repeat-associated core domain-containing protein [Candidatus Electrothrix sp. AUS4]
MGEYNAAGELTSRYTHGLGLIGKDDLFYTFDGNGNTSEMTDASMAITNYYLYEPFGKSLHALEQVDNEFEFVGQLGVRQMGDDLIYMRNRFYAPSTGRFMSEDPIGLAGGDVSFYRYVANDPVNWVDSWGLELSYSQQVGVTIANTVGATIGGVIGGGPLGAAIGGSIAAAGATALMDGATVTDIKNNALTGFLSGGTGGAFGGLAELGMQGMKGAITAGLFSGMFDFVLSGVDPFFKEPCP